MPRCLTPRCLPLPSSPLPQIPHPPPRSCATPRTHAHPSRRVPPVRRGPGRRDRCDGPATRRLQPGGDRTLGTGRGPDPPRPVAPPHEPHRRSVRHTASTAGVPPMHGVLVAHRCDEPHDLSARGEVVLRPLPSCGAAPGATGPPRPWAARPVRWAPTAVARSVHSVDPMHRMQVERPVPPLGARPSAPGMSTPRPTELADASPQVRCPQNPSLRPSGEE